MGPGTRVGLGTGIALPGTHPGTHPVYPPCPTPGTPTSATVLMPVPRGAVRHEQYGRGAQIRRPTHLKVTILRHKGYDRGL